jgi:1-deoxy-D-xylulose-5-phosphate synthase
MAPGDAADVTPMLDFSLTHDGPVSMRYPKTGAATIDRPASVVELGKSEIYRWGKDGMFVVFGTQFSDCVAAAEQLQSEGLDVGVINARFAKPLDTETILRAIRECPFVITVEESTLVGGFGSAVLEAANDAGLNTSTITRLGIPDRFVEHGERGDLLDSLNLSADGLARVARNCAASSDTRSDVSPEVSTI